VTSEGDAALFQLKMIIQLLLFTDSVKKRLEKMAGYYLDNWALV